MTLPSIVDPTESLGRFLPEKTYFSRAKNAVLPKAFMPRNLCLAVFRIEGLRLEEVWEIGQSVIDAMPNTPNNKELFGVGEIKALRVEELHLQTYADNIPLRHADVRGWPNDKDMQKSIAQELAAAAKLILK